MGNDDTYLEFLLEKKNIESNTYFNEIKNRYIKDAIYTNNYAKAKDVNRNHVNYGCCTSWARVLRDMGHDTNTPVWEDDGVLKIPFLSINGKKIIEFEEAKENKGSSKEEK